MEHIFRFRRFVNESSEMGLEKFSQEDLQIFNTEGDYTGKKEEFFGEEDSKNLMSYYKKMREMRRKEITPEEMKSWKKYVFLKKQVEFFQKLTTEEQDLIRSYSRKMHRGELSLITQEEENALRKFLYLKKRG
jgi:hypothetical protein